MSNFYHIVVFESILKGRYQYILCCDNWTDFVCHLAIEEDGECNRIICKNDLIDAKDAKSMFVAGLPLLCQCFDSKGTMLFEHPVPFLLNETDKNGEDISDAIEQMSREEIFEKVVKLQSSTENRKKQKSE